MHDGAVESDGSGGNDPVEATSDVSIAVLDVNDTRPSGRRRGRQVLRLVQAMRSANVCADAIVLTTQDSTVSKDVETSQRTWMSFPRPDTSHDAKHFIKSSLTVHRRATLRHLHMVEYSRALDSLASLKRPHRSSPFSQLQHLPLAVREILEEYERAAHDPQKMPYQDRVKNVAGHSMMAARPASDAMLASWAGAAPSRPASRYSADA